MNNDIEKTDNNDTVSKYKITQVMLWLRAAIGGYLLYLTYSLVEGYLDGNGLDLPVLIIVSVIFGAVGVLLIGFSLKSLIRGEYVGGKADYDDED